MKTRGKTFAYAPYTGAVLKNGATVVQSKHSTVQDWDIVICIRGDERELVVWNLGPDGECQSGFYSHDLAEAFAEYERRK